MPDVQIDHGTTVFDKLFQLRTCQPEKLEKNVVTTPR